LTGYEYIVYNVYVADEKFIRVPTELHAALKRDALLYKSIAAYLSARLYGVEPDKEKTHGDGAKRGKGKADGLERVRDHGGDAGGGVVEQGLDVGVVVGVPGKRVPDRVPKAQACETCGRTGWHQDWCDLRRDA
jgi:hypothetical protein